MHPTLKKLLPHLAVLLLFVVAALAYFSPVLQGKMLFQSDIVQYTGMAKQQNDFRENTGKETYWTESAFGGMPTYQLGAKYPHNYIKQLDSALRFLPRPADYLFLYFIGMYILLVVLKVDYKLAFLGALAFGFSTYLIIILGVGHNAKAHAIAYMPFVLSGIFLTFRGKYIYGFLLTSVAVALELAANHFQMTYYLIFLIVIIGIMYLIDAIRKKMLPHYFRSVGLMAIGALIAVGLNATNILATREYADFSTRGNSDLTINPDGTPKNIDNGLGFEYITQYSYGKLESFDLFIPRFMGGASHEAYPKDGHLKEALIKLGASPQEAGQVMQQVPMYWGEQPIVAAPAYVGAVLIFLSVLALFLVRGRFKWWILTAFFLSLFLSWGKNFSFLTEFFIEYVPLYNKFRAVSSVQVIIELILPVLAIVGLHKYFALPTAPTIKSENSISHFDVIKKKALIYSIGIVGGVTLLFILLKSSFFDFVSPYDAMIREQLGVQVVDAMKEDRMSVFTQDAFRSLILVLIVASILWFYLKGKVKKSFAIGLLAIVVLFDLVGVDKRYVTNDDFVQARIMEKPFEKNGADIQILEDAGYYRVYDAADPNGSFNSGRSSYFHNALGGYHAAKPQRMEDLDEFYIAKGNIGILNMMNVKYIITQNKNGGPVAQRNPYANGPAWFVENVIEAKNTNDEITLLDSLDTKKTAVIASQFQSQVTNIDIVRDTTATIDLVSHAPNHLVYEASSKTPQLLLFSEVYFPNGWNAYINGKPAEYFRADYVLRAMRIPAGNNKIEFKFEPKVIQTGSTISLMSGILLLLIFLGGVFYKYRKVERHHHSAE